MNKKYSIIRPFSFLGFLLLSSCAFHSGMMTSNLPGDSDMQIVGMAKGEAKTAHILGIGGLAHDAIIDEAKRNLYANYPLKTGQFFANTTVNFKVTPLILVTFTKVTVTADIFGKPTGDKLHAVYNHDYNGQMNTISILKGDSVLIYEGLSPRKGLVVEAMGNGKFMVQTSEDRSSLKSEDQVFFDNPDLVFGEREISVGDEVVYNTEEVAEVGKVIAMNKRFALLGIEGEYSRTYKKIECSNIYKKK